MKEKTKQDADMKKQAGKKGTTPKEKIWRAFAGLILMTMAVGLWTWISHTSHHSWLVGSIPIALALWALVVIRQGYFLGRARRWRRRQQEEREAKDRLNIPPGIKKPKDFPLVDAIDQAQHDQLPQPPDYQGRYRAAGLTVALLPALALLCLALQVLLLPHGTPWGIGLVAAEALLLVYLIFLVWTSPNPSLRWVRARFRAELLRREQYLCLTATGPYLGLPAEMASGACQRRLDRILHGDFAQLKRLLPLATPAGAEHEGDQAWIDTLWNHPRPSAIFPDLLERMQCYRHYRIDKQRLYFSLGIELNERGEKRIMKHLKGAVVFAFLLAVIHGPLACLRIRARGTQWLVRGRDATGLFLTSP